MTQTLAPPAASPTRVRFVFDDTVVSFRLGGPPTFGDVAWAMGHLALKRGTPPVAVDVMLTAPFPASPDGMGTPDAR